MDRNTAVLLVALAAILVIVQVLPVVLFVLGAGWVMGRLWRRLGM
jgi:hypothetical protein